ncbi:MAG: MiaB/RimO family radical SAM methylthiotransferase [Candidatus Moraniibacteriota bacterium]|nr:MAG: MiaB/RimO family radical SAM methylthiotransferase [Candidatus Moranbacteria bacterium]
MSQQTYFIQTFGCQQNVADSERLASYYEARGFRAAENLETASTLIVNTCIVRDRAEEKVYGLVKNLREKSKRDKDDLHIVVTGCLVGAAAREPSGKLLKRMQKRLPDVEFLPLEEVGFEQAPKRNKGKLASIVISNGCNNYCAFCIVPFSRGKERSRPFQEIIDEVEQAVRDGKSEIMLLGQNVNSYGADILFEAMKNKGEYKLPSGELVEPVMVKHLGRHRIPTIFPQLLEAVATLPGVEKVSFLSSNPWDFSDILIDVIARHANIDRLLHLPIQAGSNKIIKAMNRWYTREEYLDLIERIRTKVPEVKFTTDIIVGFPGETLEDFAETLDIARQVKFERAYIAWYSPRHGTVALKMNDDVDIHEKQRRYTELDHLVLRLAGRERLIGKGPRVQKAI